MVTTRYIPTDEQFADILTKSPTKLQHEYLFSKLGILDIFTTSHT